MEENEIRLMWGSTAWNSIRCVGGAGRGLPVPESNGGEGGEKNRPLNWEVGEKSGGGLAPALVARRVTVLVQQCLRGATEGSWCNSLIVGIWRSSPGKHLGFQVICTLSRKRPEPAKLLWFVGQEGGRGGGGAQRPVVEEPWEGATGTGHPPHKLPWSSGELDSAQPFLRKHQIITHREINRQLPKKQAHLHAEGGDGDEHGACDLIIPKRDNFGGACKVAPHGGEVVCFGGLFFWVWECRFLVAGTQPLIRSPPSSGTNPASCKNPPGSNHI
jgi:hypothetical protein